MNAVLQDFLQQTADKFDYLEKTDRDFCDVYQIEIKTNGTYIKSEAYSRDLAQVEVWQTGISSIEQLCSELLEILNTDHFYEWLKRRDTYYSSFKIDLFNSIILWERLVEVDDEGIHYEQFGSLDQVREYNQRKK